MTDLPEKDEEILEKSIENPKFFELIVDKYQDVFLRTAGRVLKSREDTEDVIQEAFTKIYFNAKKFKKQEGVEFKSWAFKILMNCAFTRYRKLKKTFVDAEYLDELLYVCPEPAETPLERKEKRDEIDSVIEKIPEDLGELMRKHYIEDRPYEEIAKGQGITINALKMKLFRARKSFKKIMEGMK